MGRERHVPVFRYAEEAPHLLRQPFRYTASPRFTQAAYRGTPPCSLSLRSGLFDSRVIDDMKGEGRVDAGNTED
jgi:hypothetical protein